MRKAGCWRLESAIPGADVHAAAGVLQALPHRDAERPGAAWQRPTTVSSVACCHAPLRCSVLQNDQTTRWLVGKADSNGTYLFGYARSGFLGRRCVMSRLTSRRTPLMCAQHHDETLRCPVTRHWMAQQDRRIAGIIKLLEFMSQLKWPLRRFRRRPRGLNRRHCQWGSSPPPATR
jgi:hypothetical protein